MHFEGEFSVPGKPLDVIRRFADVPRMAGCVPGAVLDSVLFAATAADVRHVVTSGRDVVQDGRHLLVEDVPAELDAAVRAVLAVPE